MGDMNTNSVKGLHSIYDGEFTDESYHLKHEEIGLIGMCKRSGF